MRLRRITVDWDSKNEKDFWKFLRRIKRKGFTDLIIKPSKRGYHVFIWTRINGNKLDLRKHFGDDPKHLYMDQTHRNARQTLFNKKKNL